MHLCPVEFPECLYSLLYVTLELLVIELCYPAFLLFKFSSSSSGYMQISYFELGIFQTAIAMLAIESGAVLGSVVLLYYILKSYIH